MKKLAYVISLSSLAVAGQANACDKLNDYAKKLKDSGKYDVKDIDTLKDLSVEYVNDFDKAVLLGTTNQEYICNSKEWHLREFVQQIESGKKCNGKTSIDLRKCVTSLICEGKLETNLDSDLLCYYN